MRPEDRNAAYLWDIAEAAKHVMDFVDGMRFFDYESNRLVQAAVEREIEIIGEAARRLSDEFKDAHEGIPWRGMIAQRNVLAHEYGEIRQERLWVVAKERIPELLEALQPLLPEIPK
jgi:uncharacterized protein with HEPN domain